MTPLELNVFNDVTPRDITFCFFSHEGHTQGNYPEVASRAVTAVTRRHGQRETDRNMGIRLRPRLNITKRSDQWREGNLRAARVILADPELYGGANALLVKAAKATVAADWHGPDRDSRIEASMNETGEFDLKPCA